MTTRQEREAAFHDRVFEGGKRPETAKFYSVDESSSARYEQLLDRARPGTRVLEYGCGPGSAAYYLAERGASVFGIDISSVAIERAAQAAAEQGLSDRTNFTVMDAEALRFEDRSFDLVCGSGILHHLDLERAFGEITRVLKPGGQGVFMEPLGHNPLINLYRRRTPELRTEDEHPLLMSDLELARRYFGDVQAQFFHLGSLLAIPLRNRPSFARTVAALDAADRALFRAVPAARRYAWMTVLRLAEPKSAPT